MSSFCLVPGHVVSACLPVSPFAGFLLPGSCWTPCLLVSGCLRSCGLRVSACLSLSPFMWIPFVGFLGTLSPFVSLHVGFCWVTGLLVSLCLPSCELLLPGSWAPCPCLSPLCPFMRVPCLGLSLFIWVPFAGFLSTLSLVSACLLGSLGPVPEHPVSACLPSCGFLLRGSWAPCLRLSPIFPFMWVPFAGLLGSLSPLVSLCHPSCEFLLVHGHLVSTCLALSPFMWVPFAGLLSSLSPLVSLCLPSRGFLLPGSWAPCLRLSLSPSIWFPFAKFLSSLFALFSPCPPSFPEHNTVGFLIFV